MRKFIGFILVCSFLLMDVSAIDLNSYYGEAYSGEPFVIGEEASVLKFCDFDKGPSGVAYKETDANPTSWYRPGEVDCYDFGMGKTVVAGLSTGEWLNYTIRVEKSGYYDLDIGSVWSWLIEPSGTIHLEVNEKDITGPVKISETESLVEIPRQTIKNVFLKKGDYVLKLVVDKGNGSIYDMIVTPSEGLENLKLRSLKLNKNYIELEEGDVDILNVFTEPSDIDLEACVWESDNEVVATVSENGMIKALSSGIAGIKFTLGGKTASCKVNVKPKTKQILYRDIVLEDGLEILCSEYNRGGSGISYYKTDGKTASIEGEKGIFYVGSTVSGDWFKYTFESKKDDLYTIGVLTNTEEESGAFTLILDDEAIFKKQKVQKGVSWKEFLPVEKRDVEIKKGTHTLKLLIDEAGGMYKGITFKRSRVLDDLKADKNYKGTPYGGKPTTVGIEMKKLELWKYDEGGNGIAYNKKTTQRQGIVTVKERTEEAVHLYNFDDGISSVASNEEGDWIKYTLEIDKNGYYDVSVTTAWTDEWNPAGAMHLELDDVPITEVMDMPATGKWNNWTDIDLGTVYLPKGVHILKFVVDKSGSNYTRLTFSFNGEDFVTKGEFAAALAKNVIDSGEVTDNFSDVSADSHIYKYIGTLKEMGVLKGNGNNLFKPDDYITNEQALYILSELLTKTNRMAKVTSIKPFEEYDDGDELGDWSRESIKKLADAGLMLGAQNKISKDSYINVTTAANYADFAGKCIALVKPVPEIKPIYLSKEISPAFDWLKEEMVRGMYVFVSDIDDTSVVDNLKDMGINLIVVHLQGKDNMAPDKFPGFANKIKNWQDHLGIRVILSLPYGADDYYGNTQFGKYSTGGDAKWWRTPCPLSEEYWQRVIGDRMEEAARQGITGAVADMEMYAADQTRLPGSCYCDECWVKFALEYTSLKEPLSIPDEKRAGTLATSGHSFSYARWQEIEVSKILRKIEQRVHKVNPDFIIGNLLDMESLPGLSRGFGTETMPSLIFSETEYSGAISSLADRVNSVESLGYPSIYLPGFWPKPLTPSVLKEKIVQASPVGGGYWIWNVAAFGNTTLAEEYQQHSDYTDDEYIASLIEANKLLDEGIKTGKFEDIKYDVVAPTYVAERIENIPTDADWEKAPFTEVFKYYNDFGEAKVSSKAKLLWNGKKLFIKTYNDEPEMSRVAANGGKRDDPNLWMEDCNEVFWKFRDETAYIHYIAGKDGNYADYYGNGYGADDISLNYDMKVKTLETENGWSLELEIPLTINGERYAQPGEEISVEICRFRPLNSETTCWAPTFGTYRGSPSLWGKVTLK